VYCAAVAARNSPCHPQKACHRNNSILVETAHSFHDLLSNVGYESNDDEDKLIHLEKEIAVNTGHMTALQTKHAEIDAQIEIENNRPHPDDDLIHRLKKQKLHIKDTLSQEANSA
jgi:uncharacterized protein